MFELASGQRGFQIIDDLRRSLAEERFVAETRFLRGNIFRKTVNFLLQRAISAGLSTVSP